MVGVVERRAERRGEEPVGQPLTVRLAPLRPLVAGPTLGIRRASHSTIGRHTGHVSVSNGGTVIAARSTASVMRTRASARSRSRHTVSGSSTFARMNTSSSGQRLRHDEGVLDEGPHVVIDVDDGRELGPSGEAHGDVDVVAVAQHVDHLLRPVHLGLAETSEPLRQPVGPLRQPPPDASGQDVVVAGELGDHGQERGGLDPVDVEERVHQLAEGVRRLAGAATEPILPWSTSVSRVLTSASRSSGSPERSRWRTCCSRSGSASRLAGTDSGPDRRRAACPWG